MLSLCLGIFFPFAGIDKLADWKMGDTGMEPLVQLVQPTSRSAATLSRHNDLHAICVHRCRNSMRFRKSSDTVLTQTRFVLRGSSARECDSHLLRLSRSVVTIRPFGDMVADSHRRFEESLPEFSALAVVWFLETYSAGSAVLHLTALSERVQRASDAPLLR